MGIYRYYFSPAARRAYAPWPSGPACALPQIGRRDD